MHSLLQRQLKRFFADRADQPRDWEGFLEAVGAAYVQSDEDRAMLERSLELSSLELMEANAETRRRAAAELETITEAVPDLLYKLDLRGCLVWWNKRVEDVTGLSAAELMGRHGIAFFPAEEQAAIARAIAAAIEEGQTEVEARLVTPEGPVPYHFKAVSLKDAAGDAIGITGVGHDISERKRAEETIRHLAYHDALTGLPNRTLLQDRLTVALAQAQRSGQMLAVLFVDLDRFKLINDTLGHAVGDRLLQVVSAQLKNLLREGDTVARVGGDEFVLLLPSLERVEHAGEVSDRVLQKLRQPRRIGGQELHTTASIGVTIYPEDGANAETLLSNADIAMYRAKEEGRNNVQLFTSSMNASISLRVSLENDLRKALGRRELVLHYQPIADAEDGRIIGAEALLRWKHPERGLLMPADFITIAEETGLIVPIGEWVLRTACAQARAWHKAGHSELRMSVNLSARQFLQPGLVETVRSCLRQAHLGANRLQLEITESIAMQNSDLTAQLLHALEDMGVRVSIDDFGTGHSSLSYLKNFRIDTLKIDKSFVSGLPGDANDAAIVAATIAMARSLNLAVVAEGVETKGQLEFLRAHGCDMVQGYLLGRPAPPAQLEQRVASGAEAGHGTRVAIT